jgi:putative ABC transport system permease protein
VQVTTMTEGGRVNAQSFEVAGIIDAGVKEMDSDLAHLSLAAGQQLLNTRKITRMSVLLRAGRDPYAFARSFNAAVESRFAHLRAVPVREHPFGELQRRSEQLLSVFRSFVVIIVVTIAGMSVLMTTMRATAERTREIGTLRAVGYRRRHIVALFTGEAALLAVAATAVGAGATLVLTALVNTLGITYSGGVLTEHIPLIVALVPGSYAFACAFLPSVAVVAAFVPAWRASRLNIPEALAET